MLSRRTVSLHVSCRRERRVGIEAEPRLVVAGRLGSVSIFKNNIISDSHHFDLDSEDVPCPFKSICYLGKSKCLTRSLKRDPH